MSWEVRAAAVATAPTVVELPERAAGSTVEPKTRRPVYFRGGWQDTPIFARDALQAGTRISGPAVMEVRRSQRDSAATNASDRGLAAAAESCFKQRPVWRDPGRRRILGTAAPGRRFLPGPPRRARRG